MAEITPIVIPDEHVAFAKIVAELAAGHKIKSFDITYRADFKPDDSRYFDRNLYGDIKIHYASTDGRGRPSKELSIRLETHQTLSIISEPKSFS